MFNTLNTVRPRPYPQRSTTGYNAGNEGADKDGHNSQGNERQQQQAQENVVARGRASEVAQAQSMQPMPQQMGGAYQNATRPYPSSYTPAGINNPAYRGNTQINPMQYQAAANSSYSPIGAQAQTPLNAKSNKVNIAQIIKDFRNTMKAIATPADVEAEVDKYLQIVNQQVKAPNPQINLIQSNLKFAASLLDKYISETLNKESKVVQNWLDALFLQRINYNYDENDVNPNFLVQFSQDGAGQNTQQQQSAQPQSETAEVANEEPVPNNIPVEEPIQEYVPQTVEEEYTVAKEKFAKKPNITIIPQDTRLKSLFLEAKKQAFANNPQKAMSIFKEAFNRASELKDNETQSRICLEIGKIYDDNDFVVQALTSYNKSLEYTTDTNVKSRAHYSMAQIYDDVNQTGAALDHYITSISYACKSDDLVSQSDSLTRVANIYADQYNEGAFDYYDIARKLSEQTDDFNVKGYVLSNTADACVQFRKNDKALKYYAEAVKNYEKIGSAEEIAENYKSAAELMISYNNNAKAKSLLKKSMINAVKTDNEDLISEINLLLSSIEQ